MIILLGRNTFSSSYHLQFVISIHEIFWRNLCMLGTKPESLYYRMPVMFSSKKGNSDSNESMGWLKTQLSSTQQKGVTKTIKASFENLEMVTIQVLKKQPAASYR